MPAKSNIHMDSSELSGWVWLWMWAWMGKPLCCWWLIWPIENDAKIWKMTETLAHGYSFESTHQELSNAYQYDRVKMFFKEFCILVLWTKVGSALEGLNLNLIAVNWSTSLCQARHLLDWPSREPRASPLRDTNKSCHRIEIHANTY